MYPRTRLSAGTLLVVALTVVVTRRRDQASILLYAGDRIEVEADHGGLIHGRLASGTRTEIRIVQADLARMTHDDGRAITAGGTGTTLAPPRPGLLAKSQAGAKPQDEAASGYLKGRALLDFCDMGR